MPVWRQRFIETIIRRQISSETFTQVPFSEMCSPIAALFFKQAGDSGGSLRDAATLRSVESRSDAELSGITTGQYGGACG